jgi:hypothetical protein
MNGQTPPGTSGFEYRGQVVRTNGLHSLASIVRNTVGSATAVGRLSTNPGIEDVGINDTGQLDANPVSVRLTFYDASGGNVVGSQPVLTLQPGQVSQVTNLWATYQLPASTTDVIVVATEVSGTAQIRGYVGITDIDTNDFSFFYMQ